MADLNKTILKSIEAINAKAIELSDTTDFLKNECTKLTTGLTELDKQAMLLTSTIEALETKLQASKKKLMNSKKKHDNSEEMALLQNELTLNREKEKNLIDKRNQLETTLSNFMLTIQKLDKLLSANDTILACLTDLQTTTHKSFEQRQMIEISRMNAQEDEKQRISKDVHDGPAQSVSNIFLRVELCERLINNQPAKAKKELVNLKQVVRETLQDIRKIIYNIRPMSLDDLGLLPTLQRYIFIFQEESKIPVTFKAKGNDEDITIIISAAIFRIVQEALSNVKNHSEATRVMINLMFQQNELTLDITDNGKGFDVEQLKLPSENNKCFGIYNMRERVELLNGRFKVISSVGNGTTLNIGIPLISDKEVLNG